MVQFGTGYYMPMDRDYLSDDNFGRGFPADKKTTGDVGVGIGDVGLGLMLGPVPNVQAVKSKLHPGMKKLEIGFSGMGKGSAQGQTPGMYGEKQRQAFREMQKANKVDFTTHSSVGVYGLAGMDQQGNFSKAGKSMSLHEIKRAIEFAADVSRGGPVVVHTGEFNRPVADADWNNKQGDPYKGKFQMYEDEEEMASYRVVDTRTGALIQEARKNRKIARPIWNRYEPENKKYWKESGGKDHYVDSQGKVVKKGDYIDYFGNKINPEVKVPRFDKDNQRFETQQMGWSELQGEAVEMTDRARQLWRDYKEGRLSEEQFTKTNWARFKNAKSESEIKVKPEEAYIISTLETNAANSRGWAIYYGGSFDDYVEKMKKLEKAHKFYEKIEAATSEEEKWRLKKELQEQHLPPDLIPLEGKLPTERLQESIRDLKRQMQQSQEASASQWSQAEESMETIKHVEGAETYAIREACDTYASAALSAMKHSDELKQKGKLKKSMFLAMENLFPESYGSHPDELMKLIKGSRERMKEILVQQGMNDAVAQKKSETHIKATFDTGHFNMWRKYWKGDQDKSLKENEENFNKWAIKKVGEMADNKIIGHVHLADNYGYQDDHLAPGEGNTPIKEMLKVLKKKGYDGEVILEAGADYTTDVSGFHTLMKTWKHFDLPVYGGGGGVGQKPWGDVGYGWFGQNQPPYFAFAPYTPSEDWTLWSGVQLD